ncbi:MULTISPECIES: TolC family protein [unclassified Variovorax]|uniref:TolC family protein n=1 Tax=unclassified Variovorax TaxID=663243 RepID=UPI002B239182|nr:MULTISPECIES: TolC family protein [unclassified Variovorax]MEB0057278.1 TolC family protein [Variovorax sp. LG9.2]MEB0111704.1 TolC family protein [Variovorax sp. RTB1]
MNENNIVKTTKFPSKPTWAALAAALCLAGCSMNPVKVTPEEVAQRVRSDQEQMYRDQVPVSGRISYSDALARALKYNLDYRLKMMETTLARGLLEVSAMDMLPKLVTEAGYNDRSNDSGGTSVGIEDRVISLRPSTSETRSHYYGRATLSWNALDFGISYFRAKQAGDEVNIADERRRKILQNIVQDVRNAYWRALGAQRLLADADQLATRIDDALGKSREAERAGVLPPTQGLSYQRALLDAMSLVNAKRQEMQFAKRELAALMSLPPGTEFTLVESTEDSLAPAAVDIDKLEIAALTNRPELREEDYKARIGVYETRKQIAALFPSLNLYAGARYDSNSYLYNSNWSDTGLNLSMDLFRLASIPAINRTNEARQKTDEARRQALAMAVLTQVRVSVERYKLAVVDQDLAAESSRVDQRLSSVSRAGASNRLESELESLRTDSRALVSRFQLATAYAATQAAYGRVLNSVGVDLLPDTVTGTDIPTLAKAIDASLLDGEKSVFLKPIGLQLASRPVSVRIADLPRGVNEAAVRSAVERIVVRNELVAGQGADALVLTLSFQRMESKATMRAQWRMTLTDPAGKQLLQQNYVSYLPSEGSDRSLGAFAEAAALSVIGDVRRAARTESTVAQQP